MIGPNGAGKTTLFNLITGDVAPSGGRVVFGGSDMTAMPPHARSRLGIGRSYQIPHPFANMSVFENLLVGAIFGGGITERESYKRCSDVLKVTGLYDKANVPARTLTLLQRKRLEMARAFAIQPKLLLLDEIAGGLTEYECGELVKTIKEIHARGTTIVWIEHIVHALVSVASRLVVMNFGQLLAQGDPHEVMADAARARSLHGHPGIMTLLHAKDLIGLLRRLPGAVRHQRHRRARRDGRHHRRQRRRQDHVSARGCRRSLAPAGDRHVRRAADRATRRRTRSCGSASPWCRKGAGCFPAFRWRRIFCSAHTASVPGHGISSAFTSCFRACMICATCPRRRCRAGSSRWRRSAAL